MMPERRELSLQLAAAVVDAVALNQNPAGAGALTINGSLASGGVATFLVPQRVAIYSAGNDSAFTFTITGTGREVRTQSETLTGANATYAISVLDYKTITGITVSGNAGALTVGSIEKGSTVPHICQDAENYSVAVDADETVDWQIDVCYDDYSPAWDVARAGIVWFPFTTADLTNNRGKISGPVQMIRLTNLSGTGRARLVILTHLLSGKV